MVSRVEHREALRRCAERFQVPGMYPTYNERFVGASDIWDWHTGEQVRPLSRPQIAAVIGVSLKTAKRFMRWMQVAGWYAEIAPSATSVSQNRRAGGPGGLGWPTLRYRLAAPTNSGVTEFRVGN